jgi:hypothetical protein
MLIGQVIRLDIVCHSWVSFLNRASALIATQTFDEHCEVPLSGDYIYVCVLMEPKAGFNGTSMSEVEPSKRLLIMLPQIGRHD